MEQAMTEEISFNIKLSDYFDHEQLQEVAKEAMTNAFMCQARTYFVDNRHAFENMVYIAVKKMVGGQTLNFEDRVRMEIKRKIEDPETYSSIRYDDVFKKIMQDTIRNNTECVVDKTKDKLKDDSSYEHIGFMLIDGLFNKLSSKGEG
jgi:hypothetical protein